METSVAVSDPFPALPAHNAQDFFDHDTARSCRYRSAVALGFLRNF